MRERKFRAWHKEKKKMLSYGELFNIDCSGEYPFLALAAGHYEDCIEPLKVELMQFTGLQDKNGVDIYEGDILIYQHMFVDKKSVSEVIWNEKYSGFASYVEDDERRYILEKELKNQFEIIGNIYENPELLEV